MLTRKSTYVIINITQGDNMTILDKALNHKLKSVKAVAEKLFLSNTVRLSKAREIEAAFKIRELLGSDVISIKRIDYSSDHTVTLIN